MQFEIKNRWTNACQWSGDIDDSGNRRENLGRAVKAALLRGANLHGANLRGADLRGANLRGANLRDADLGDADLRGANLRDADLRGANLRDADLRGADLGGANLRDADLRGANLRDADLRGADLGDADLGDADLRGADLRGADLGGADLRGADLGDADLGGAGEISALRVLTGLYQYQCMAIVTESGAPWVRMGCLWKSVEEWDRIGIRSSNTSEFPDDGSPKCEERVRAFEFVRDMALRMAEEWKASNPKTEE